MGGGSIETPVQGRDARRQQLDLGMSDGAELAAEIAHLVRPEIMVLAQIEKLFTSDGTRLIALWMLAGGRPTG